MCTNISKLEASNNQLSPAASASELSASPTGCFWSDATLAPVSLSNTTGFAQELIMSLMIGGGAGGFAFPPPPPPPAFASLQPLCLGGFGANAVTAGLPAAASADYFLQQRFKVVQQDEPKPNHSYIGLIAMAILSSKDKKLLLSEIYDWILKNYTYFRNKGPGWRNSVRHNLSLNDCFIKVGRAANGKGHYWSIHPANLDDFHRGDFRRRKAQRKVRKHMGLSCPDDEDSSRSRSPSPARSCSCPSTKAPNSLPLPIALSCTVAKDSNSTDCAKSEHGMRAKKRAFDMDSLLQPDEREKNGVGARKTNSSVEEEPTNAGEMTAEQSQFLQQYLTNLSAFCIQQGCSNACLAALANCTPINCS